MAEHTIDDSAGVTDETDDAPALLDAEEEFRSLNGFEEIALEQLFRTKLKTLANDEIKLMRALLVIRLKREGMGDADAFRTVMLQRIDSVTERFKVPDDQVVEDDVDPSVQAQRDAEYADFVVGVGVSFLPDQYRQLTIGERIALKDAARRARGE